MGNCFEDIMAFMYAIQKSITDSLLALCRSQSKAKAQHCTNNIVVLVFVVDIG